MSMEQKNFTVPKGAEIVYSDDQYNVIHCNLFGESPKSGILSNEEQTRGVVIKKEIEDAKNVAEGVACRTFPSTRDYVETFDGDIQQYNWTVAREMNSLSLFHMEIVSILKQQKRWKPSKVSGLMNYHLEGILS